MSQQVADKMNSAVSSREDRTAPETRPSRLQALSAEVVDLLYAQTSSPDSISTPAEVCRAFSEILLRQWELCCIIIYLRDDSEGRLRQAAIHTDPYFVEARANEVSAVMVSAVEREGRELQVWLDEEDGEPEESSAEWRRVLEAAGLRACVAIPIHTRGMLIGALIAVTAFPDRLRAALKGIRFIAAPIVIAVSNARRAVALREQHQRIEHLVQELQQRSDALEEANQELQRVARYRSLFLARMSHELRTPLTSILGFAEILIDHENLTDAQRRFCEKIHDSGLQLQASLNQLVDLSRLEAGQAELFLHEFSLREAIRESCVAVARLAQKQNVKLDCHMGGDLPSIVSDEGKLRQVLYNFIAYAISRSPAGASVTIRAECVASSRFQIKIEDEGEPLSNPSCVFKTIELCAPSERATNMDELGLVIARRLVNVLGGTVTLENQQPRGLMTLIELPARPAQS